MPLLRYFVCASGFVLCSFLASNSLLLAPQLSAVSEQAEAAPSSLTSWRAAEARKSGADAQAAIVLPTTMAQPAVTPERLAFERQMASNTVSLPVLAEALASGVDDARAEIIEASRQQPTATVRMASKPRRKPIMRRELATAERPQYRSEFGGFFGGTFAN